MNDLLSILKARSTLCDQPVPEDDRHLLQEPDMSKVDYLQAVAKARDMISALNQPAGTVGARRWIMSIPAEPDRDPDLIISAGLDAGEERIKHLEALVEQMTRPCPMKDVGRNPLQCQDAPCDACFFWLTARAEQLEWKIRCLCADMDTHFETPPTLQELRDMQSSEIDDVVLAIDERLRGL